MKAIMRVRKCADFAGRRLVMLRMGAHISQTGPVLSISSYIFSNIPIARHGWAIGPGYDG
jgi:hypothetical protein